MNEKSRDIRNILLVFAFSVFGAIFLTYWTMSSYTQINQYKAQKVLLSPSLIESLHKKTDEKRSKNLFFFNGIEFSYLDKISHKLKTSKVSDEQYESFYKSVEALNNIEPVSAELEDQFVSPTGKLTINLVDHSTAATQVFQVVEFLESGYFRVLLHESNGLQWAYFYKPNITDKLIQNEK